MELNKIYNKCAFELISEIPDNFADLVILDPNYQDWDSFLADGLFVQSVRIAKPEANILCFTKQPFDFNLRNEINHLFRREIVWTFTNGGAWVSKKLPLVSHQKIYHCAIDKKNHYFKERTGNPYSSKTKDFKRSKKVFEGYEKEGKQFVKNNNGVWLRDHLHYNKPHTGKIPSKPLSLYNDLINCYCPAKGIVVEPFCGSGNFAISCIDQGKKYIGSELNESVFNYALKNISQHQPVLKF